MSLWKAVAFSALMIAALLVRAVPGQGLTDPYEILNRHFEAAGGLDNLKAERTQYFEGDIALAGMQGSIKAWTQKPDRMRAEISLGPLNIKQGDNGEIRWVLDSNGKLQVTTKSDEIALRRRDVKRRMARYEYAEPTSDIFSLSFEGTEEVEGTDCYVIKVTNSINDDQHIYYISVDGFRLKKKYAFEGEDSADTYYDDYRRVDGIMVAFYVKEVPDNTGQPQEITVTQYESNPDIDPALFEAPEEAGKDFEFTAGNASENIPFRFIGNHLFIPVSVGGVERMWIIDTGAAMSVIDKAFADEMGLDMQGNLKGVGAGGTVDVSFAVLPPYELKGIRFKEQNVAVIDMSELIRRLGIDVVGILGFDFLSRFVTRIDYANELVSFYDPESFEYAGDGIALDVHVDESVFRSSATLDAEHSGTWLCDIGAGTTHLDGRYALREGYASKHGVLRMAHGAANEYQIKMVKSETLEFAGFTLYEPLISFAYGGTDTVFTADRIGILGNTVFRNFILYVDYAGERMVLEKSEKFDQTWPEDHSGLSIAWTVDRDGVEVIYVSPDTPAERAGFEKGDILKSINGLSIEPSDGVLSVRDLLAQKPGTTHEIVIERAGHQKTISLALADLY